MLANVFAPMGFIALGEYEPNKVVQRPVAANRAAIGAAASAALAIGDAYAIDANGNAIHAGPDAVVRGVVVGFNLQPVTGIMNDNGPLSEDYLAAASAGNIIGIEDPNVEFLVTSDNVAGFAATNVGGVFNLGDAADDATYRQSRQYLDVNSGAGQQFKALRLDNSPADNAYGVAARVVVKLAQAY